MKKIIFSAAAIMLASAFSFAGTPETKEAKPEVKTETNVKPESNSNTQVRTYQFNSIDAQGRISFSEGSSAPCPGGATNPCKWSSSSELSSPMTADEIDSHPDVTVTSRRN